MKKFTLSRDQFIAINSLSAPRQKEIYKALVDFFFTGKTDNLSSIANLVISFYKTSLKQRVINNYLEETLTENKVKVISQTDDKKQDNFVIISKEKKERKETKKEEEKERSKEKEQEIKKIKINKKNKRERACDVPAYAYEKHKSLKDSLILQDLKTPELETSGLKSQDLKTPELETPEFETSNSKPILNSIFLIQPNEDNSKTEKITSLACSVKNLSISETVNPFNALSDSLSKLKTNIQNGEIFKCRSPLEKKSKGTDEESNQLQGNQLRIISSIKNKIQDIKKLADLEQSRTAQSRTGQSRTGQSQIDQTERTDQSLAGDLSFSPHRENVHDYLEPQSTESRSVFSKKLKNIKKIHDTEKSKTSDQIINSWNEIAIKHGRAKIRVCPPDLIRAIKSRISEHKITLAEFFSIADKALELDKNLREGTPTWGGANLDFFTRPKNFRRAIEIIENPPVYKNWNSHKNRTFDDDEILPYDQCPL